MRDVTSFTELSLLADCEQKWAFRYIDGDRTEQSPAQRKGSWLHQLIAAWRQGDETVAMARIQAEWEVNPPDPQLEEDTLWLFNRYKAFYGPQHRPRIAATELRLVHPLPYTDLTVVTYIDEMVHLPSGLWAVERKSMRDWRRLNTLDVDPQVSLVLWQLREEGWPVKGLLYDAIRTYRWKPKRRTLREIEGELRTQGLVGKDLKEQAKLVQSIEPGTEAPLADSFRLLPQTRTDYEIESALAEARKGVLRRAMLGAGLAPMRSIGFHCDNCDYRYKCFTNMGFDLDLTIVGDDDAAEAEGQ